METEQIFIYTYIHQKYQELRISDTKLRLIIHILMSGFRELNKTIDTPFKIPDTQTSPLMNLCLRWRMYIHSNIHTRIHIHIYIYTV